MGHSYSYLDHVDKASQQLDWHFKALLPRKNILKNLPFNWKKVIDLTTVKECYETVEKKSYKRDRKYIRAQMRMRYYLSLFKALSKEIFFKKCDSTVLFLEGFSSSDIRLIANLLKFLPKKSLQLWLLYRYPAFFIRKELSTYQTLHEKIEKMGVRLRLITDSELLQEDLSQHFRKQVHLFPIPLEKTSSSSKTVKSSPIKCWWPGVVRPGKGQKIIQEFAQSSHPLNEKIQLIAYQEANLSKSPQGPRINPLLEHLSQEEYQQMMEQSDLILLPYTEANYQMSTSNVFLEAILAGSIPVVTPYNWMAHELKKFSLEKLIIDWEPQSLAEQLIEIYEDETIKEKLKEMKEKYLNFHSIENYSKHMQALKLAQ